MIHHQLWAVGIMKISEEMGRYCDQGKVAKFLVIVVEDTEAGKFKEQ